MRKMEIGFFFILFFLIINSAYSKPIFLGDSITYQVAISYKKDRPVDAKYLVGSGLKNQLDFNWVDYAKTLKIRHYDCVYLVLGTNDFISKHEIFDYRNKAIHLIRELKKQNNYIIWVLPPTLREVKKNLMLGNTREAIQLAASAEQIATIDMRDALGQQYIGSLNGQAIRTNDGIHITEYGADLFVRLLSI
ncbi:DUF459 domain-containing protein [Xenorhabdus stockiae]|uniref:DUF459 domain-containing protein n=1 Tax=Xenorhabdus stockiae TaxID=351614 RepID=UPI004063837B